MLSLCLQTLLKSACIIRGRRRSEPSRWKPYLERRWMKWRRSLCAPAPPPRERNLAGENFVVQSPLLAIASLPPERLHRVFRRNFINIINSFDVIRRLCRKPEMSALSVFQTQWDGSARARKRQPGAGRAAGRGRPDRRRHHRARGSAFLRSQKILFEKRGRVVTGLTVYSVTRRNGTWSK